MTWTKNWHWWHCQSKTLVLGSIYIIGQELTLIARSVYDIDQELTLVTLSVKDIGQELKWMAELALHTCMAKRTILLLMSEFKALDILLVFINDIFKPLVWLVVWNKTFQIWHLFHILAVWKVSLVCQTIDQKNMIQPIRGQDDNPGFCSTLESKNTSSELHKGTLLVVNS